MFGKTNIKIKKFQHIFRNCGCGSIGWFVELKEAGVEKSKFENWNRCPWLPTN